jgi:tetratricopeptide (TPR) repeat protein
MDLQKDKNMDKTKGFYSILIPSATVFTSSACIMILELVASRLIARHLGSSLYTWTAVIGVVLAGITIGNYLGGRIADKFTARKALSVIFILSSVACVAVVILNNLVGEWLWLWQLSWPVRIFSHVALVFLMPSLLLGTISPVVAKMALDRGLSTGRTVGDIYAWGAAGSILGTFAAGFYLIPTMGTIAIIWSVGGVLLAMGILYWVRLWPAYLWLVVFFCALVMGMSPAESMQKAGSSTGLREKNDPAVLYEDETPYCHVAVRQLSDKPDRRQFIQDKLVHSEILMDDKYNLQYFHTLIFSAVTNRFCENKNKLSVLHIGGGGYVFPQYIEHYWPGSRNDVAEIDPRITKAAKAAFGLSENTSINTIQMDARNYIDGLIQRERNGQEIPKYDFIYEDAFSDYSVPYQLVTREFNDKLYKILTANGIYLINAIDTYASGLFLGSYLNTLEQTFPYVNVITEAEPPKSSRRIFVIIASKRQLNLENLNITNDKDKGKNTDTWLLSASDMKQLKQNSRGIILTDDYSPVENLLAPVVLGSGKGLLINRYRDEAKKLIEEGKFSQAITKYEKMLETDSGISIEAFNEIAILSAQQGNLEKTIEYFKKALAYNEASDFKSNMGNIYFSLGVALQQLGRAQEASKDFDIAISEYQKQLIKTPDSIKTLSRLGDALASNGDFVKAASYFQKAVNLEPAVGENQSKLVGALALAGEFDNALEAADNAQKFFSLKGQQQTAEEFNKLMDTIKLQKAKAASGK